VGNIFLELALVLYVLFCKSFRVIFTYLTLFLRYQSQIKKEFFGALRIRKQQEAHDSSLAATRPATTLHVYDAVKTRMDEALRDARE